MQNENLIFGINIESDLLNAYSMENDPLRKLLTKVFKELKFAYRHLKNFENLNLYKDTEKLLMELIYLANKKDLAESELSDFVIRYRYLTNEIEKTFSISLVKENYDIYRLMQKHR